MADPITAADVQAYLGELGYTIPMALLDPILCAVNKIIPCLDGAGYDNCTAHPGDWREGTALEGGMMSSVANWSYTATATIWRKLEGNDEYGDPLGYDEPEQILCDYEGGLSKKLASLGAEIVVKNTVWTEFALAAAGDYLLIGVSTEADPVVAGADEVRQVIRYADTFERLADDYAILTGV